MLAVREAIPWSFIGLLAGLAALMLFAPAPVEPTAGQALLARFTLAELPAFGVMAGTLVVILSYRLATALALDRVLVPATACAAFALALPRPFAFGDPIAYLHRVGESGLLLAILAALAAAGAPYALRFAVRPAALAGALGALAVVAAALALFAAHLSIANALVALLQPLDRLGDTYAALLIVTVVETLLWTIGIHGPATLAAIVTPVYLTMQFENTEAFADHHALPYIVVVSLFLFVFPGGAGATLPLTVMLCFSRVARLRTIARLAMVPALFNINEPLLFGLPIVFNPFLALPFVVAPALLATITYAVVAHGWVARPVYYIPSAVPAPVATYLATLDPRAVVLVLVNIAVATLVYYPFVRAYERHEARIAA